ncbi:OsmC family protein [Spiribacter roseus]|jgi:uncharacterized OsmC-like protein|uniref:OsmC family protein n=1 Tax=Spiribacter roseus TaxID=1855875 RepID=UPI000F6E4687|nr:OsmC family protein [Spiribacter roseus]AUB78630.1 hypothetical protein BBH56_05650 [Spiribacter roseus]KAF0281070.1 hypothetical protein BA900_00565 [Spiribacter roseus]KAF0284188.1 hypothetical protein BA898_07485 [Spiribacter roseus]
MDAQELRAYQQPLKEHYKDEPESARVPVSVEAQLANEDIACKLQTWSGEVVAGLHAAAGGDGSRACSADMLLQALAACAGVTLKSVATAMGIELRESRVIAEGHWDARGTLALDPEVPVGLRDVHLRFELESDADDAKLGKLIELTERYCVIYQTLASPPHQSARFVRSDT